MGTATPDDRSLGTPAVEVLPADFTMGPFLVLPDGRLTLRDSEQPPGFRFVWRECAVKVGLRADHLALRAMLGRVPSSASSSAPLRQTVFDTLRELVKAVPPEWRLRVLPDHCVSVEAEEKMPVPPTATELLTTLTRFALKLGPYLDLAMEAGLEPTARAPGTAGTANA
jgi:hypothetical protein